MVRRSNVTVAVAVAAVVVVLCGLVTSASAGAECMGEDRKKGAVDPGGQRPLPKERYDARADADDVYVPNPQAPVAGAGRRNPGAIIPGVNDRPPRPVAPIPDFRRPANAHPLRGRVVVDDDYSDPEDDDDTEPTPAAPVELGPRDLLLAQAEWDKWYAANNYPTYNHGSNPPVTWLNPYKPNTGTPTPKIYRIPAVETLIANSLNSGRIDMGLDGQTSKWRSYQRIIDAIEKKFPSTNPLQYFFVGGYVRDFLIPVPEESKDVDIGVMADPLTMAGVCSDHGWKCTELKFHWFNILKWGRTLAGFANDQVTAIESLPATLTVNAENAWRDFTVNAIYYDYHTRLFIDATGVGVQDAGRMELRIANEASRPDTKGKWKTYFDSTWYASGTGARKIARWWHMRLKGFSGSPVSEKYIISKMAEILTDDDGTFASDQRNWMSQWSQQTLNSVEKRDGKLAAIFKAVRGSRHSRSVDMDALVSGLYGLLCDYYYQESTYYTQWDLTTRGTVYRSLHIRHSDAPLHPATTPQCALGQ